MNAVLAPVLVPRRRTAFRDQLEDIRRAVDHELWDGRAGTTDLFVLRELLALAELRGTLVFGMNLRSLAERANVSMSTVWISLHRLETRGFLKVARADRLPHQSTTWRFCCPPKSANTEQGTSPLHLSLDEKHCSVLAVSRLDIAVAADVWSGPGGKSRYRVWAGLQSGPRTTSELVVACGKGLSVRTVRRNLRFLEDLGLAVRAGRMWRARSVDLDGAAVALGTAGTGDRRRARHRLERRAFRDWLRWAQDRKARIDRETGEVLVDPVAYATRLFGAAVLEVRKVIAPVQSRSFAERSMP